MSSTIIASNEDKYHRTFRLFCKTSPGSPAQRRALKIMRALRPTVASNDNADLINESLMHSREHTS